MTESFVNDLLENDKGEIYLLRFCDTNVEAISSVHSDDLQQLWMRRQLQSILKGFYCQANLKLENYLSRLRFNSLLVRKI